jgi:hypothetical protein
LARLQFEMETSGMPLWMWDWCRLVRFSLEWVHE